VTTSSGDDDHGGLGNQKPIARGKRLVDGQNFTLTLLKARRSLRRRDGGELKWGRSWRRRMDSVNSWLPDKPGSRRGATGLM
jgi:hypothetical protein